MFSKPPQGQTLYTPPFIQNCVNSVLLGTTWNFCKTCDPSPKDRGVYQYTYTLKEYVPVGLHTQVNICMTEITPLNKVNYILNKTISTHVCTARWLNSVFLVELKMVNTLKFLKYFEYLVCSQSFLVLLRIILVCIRHSSDELLCENNLTRHKIQIGGRVILFGTCTTHTDAKSLKDNK